MPAWCWGRKRRVMAVGLVVAPLLASMTSGLRAGAEEPSAAPPIVVDVPLLTPSPASPRSTQPAGSASQSNVNLGPGNTPTIFLPPLPVPLPELPPVLTSTPARRANAQRRAATSTARSADQPVTGGSPSVPVVAAAPVQGTPPGGAQALGEPRPSVSRQVARPSPTLNGDAARAVKEFTFPLGMTALVVVFLVVQTLVDRREPKLAVAPMVDELYTFR